MSEPAGPERSVDTDRSLDAGRSGDTGRSVDADRLVGAAADELFVALADRTRRRILVRLADRPDDAGAVARDLDLTRQAVAKQMRVLEETGLVHASTDARRRVHRVDPSRIREVSDLLGVVARGWDRRLAEIKERAEAQVREEAQARGEAQVREEAQTRQEARARAWNEG